MPAPVELELLMLNAPPVEVLADALTVWFTWIAGDAVALLIVCGASPVKVSVTLL